MKMKEFLKKWTKSGDFCVRTPSLKIAVFNRRVDYRLFPKPSKRKQYDPRDTGIYLLATERNFHPIIGIQEAENAVWEFMEDTEMLGYYLFEQYHNYPNKEI